MAGRPPLVCGRCSYLTKTYGKLHGPPWRWTVTRSVCERCRLEYRRAGGTDEAPTIIIRDWDGR